jgi:hypothetical protein
MTHKITFHSIVPPTPAEVAAAAATWERRGVLGRLVRTDEVGAPPEQPRRAGRSI